MVGQLFKAWDVEGKCWIPPELVCITGDGKIYTRESTEGQWMEETIPIRIEFSKTNFVYAGRD